MPVYRIRKTKAITIEKVNRPFRLSHGPTGPPGELSNATEVIANHPDVAANTSHRETIGNPHGTTAEDIGADPAGSALSVQGNLNTHVSEGGHPASNITLSDNDDFFPVKDAENSLNFITNILYQLTDDLPLFPFSIDSSVSSGTWTITVTSTVTSDIVLLIGLSRYSLPSPQVIDITSYAGTNNNPKDVYVYFEAPGGVPALVASNLSPEDKDIHHVNVSTHLASEVSTDTVNIRAEIIQHASIYEHIHDYWHTKYRAPASYISGLDVSSSPTVISVGSGVIEKIHERLEAEATSSNLGFFEILADGYVSDKISFDFSNYSDGGAIGVNKYYWVTIGVTTNGETSLVAVVQPEPVTEFQQATSAFEDGRLKAPVFPGDDILDKTFVPVCMIVVYSGNDQAQENPLRPGTYHHDLRGASSYGTGGGVTGLSQVESDDTLSGNGTPLSPIGVVYGSTINTSCEGNDPRLSDSRDPNQHTHNASEVTDFDAEVANNTAVASNTTKVSADGSVTTHNDVIDAGSGQIITNTERTKLNGIEEGATADQTGAEIKAAYESEENTNAFTDAEKVKLAGLENEKFLGTYVNLSALQTAHPTPVEGSYGHVDTGIGNEVAVYIWDASDLTYYQQAAASSAETATSVKSKYESNPDTNAFTDAEKNKLAGVELSADVTDAENVGDAISGTAEDLNPVDTDKFAQVDIDGNLIHTTFGTIKSLFKAIFDTLYAPIAKGVTGGDSHNHAGGEGGAISADSISETATREFVSISTGVSSDYYRGDKTWADFSIPVRATPLTGLDTSTNEVVDASDTVLSAAGKLQKQMTDHKANNGSDHSWLGQDISQSATPTWDSYDSIGTSAINGDYVECSVSTDPLIMHPANTYVWHDLAAFGVHLPFPTFETRDSSTWGPATTQKKIFAQKDDDPVYLTSGNQDGVRMTWQTSNLQFSRLQFVYVSFGYVPGGLSISISIESSTDGVSWSPLFTTGTLTASERVFVVKSSLHSSDSYLRLTIVSSLGLIRLSSIKLLSSRPGGQGGGKEYEYPYTWDELRNISFPAGIDVTGSISAGENEIISQSGFYRPISSADSSAPNNAIYYSTTQSKLVYKDSGGTINSLY